MLHYVSNYTPEESNLAARDTRTGCIFSLSLEYSGAADLQSAHVSLVVFQNSRFVGREFLRKAR